MKAKLVLMVQCPRCDYILEVLHPTQRYRCANKKCAHYKAIFLVTNPPKVDLTIEETTAECMNVGCTNPPTLDGEFCSRKCQKCYFNSMRS